jgi:hypothetical protein
LSKHRPVNGAGQTFLRDRSNTTLRRLSSPLAGNDALLGRLESGGFERRVEARAQRDACSASIRARGQSAPVGNAACATTGTCGPARSTSAGTSANVPRLTPWPPTFRALSDEDVRAGIEGRLSPSLRFAPGKPASHPLP